MPRKPGKMQQHREACRTLNQRADRRAAKTKNEVSLPVTRHRAIEDLNIAGAMPPACRNRRSISHRG